MDLKDATLMLLSESDGHPAVASLAKSAYDRLAAGEDVDYRLLDELIGEASGKGVLRALHARYSPVAYEAIIMPILSEIGRHKPVRPRRRPDGDDAEPDDAGADDAGADDAGADDAGADDAGADDAGADDAGADDTGADPLRASVWPPQ